MSRDWGFNLWILKIDIRKAFDAIKQTSVAAMVASKLHHTHPWEARAWLSIIHGQQLHVIPAPPASQQPVPIQQTNGVRQGSPDSPILFALKAGQILGNTLQAQQPPPLVGSSWMTPIYGPPSKAMKVTLPHLSSKARIAFHKQSHILASEAPILAKLKLIATTVATSALWGCESWPTHRTLLTAANAAQYRVVARAMGLKRRPGETGTDHYQRQIRQARLAIYKNHHIRWSTHILQAIWKLHGHIARQATAAPDNVAQATLQWRNLSWWKAEQTKPRGTRHAARYNPFLDVERYVVHTAGLRWQETAQHRQKWAKVQNTFIHCTTSLGAQANNQAYKTCAKQAPDPSSTCS